MILTRELLEEKTTMKFGETGVYIFKNTLPLQIGYYAVDVEEFEQLEKAVHSDKLPDCCIYVYELILCDDRMLLRFDAEGNRVSLGKRRIGDLEKISFDEEGNVIL